MEFVYVVKRSDLFDLATPHGFVPQHAAPNGAGPDPVARWTAAIRTRGFFLERRHAERDASFKQVIPYTLVVHGDEVLLLTRLGKGGEARLHGKLSIGVGGHINPVDLGSAAGSAAGVPVGAAGGAGAVADVLDAGCRRELEEEIAIGCAYTLAPVGIINDDSSDVGSVHFGLVNVARCASRDVAIRETDMLAGSFVPLAELRELARAERGRFETWSALIVERLADVLA